MVLNGYDESVYQGNINNAIEPGDFVIIKASEGVGYTDPDCDANYQQSKAAGKLLGVYHFARPDGNDPISEAKWFVSQIQGYLGEAILALDLETQPITPSWAKQWLDEVYALTKVRPWLYMTQSTFNTGDWSALEPYYGAWVASWGANQTQTGYGDPNAPVNINGNWTIVGVQYTSQGHLPGWGGALDLDLAYMTRDAWAKYAQGDRGQAAATPAPVTTPTTTPTPVVTPTPDPTPVVTDPTPVDTTPTDTTTGTPAPTTTPTTDVNPTPAPVDVTTANVNSFVAFFTKVWNWVKSLFKEENND